MQQTQVTVGSATTSAWIPLNTKKPYFATGLFVGLTGTVNLTYKVQHAVPTNTNGDCLPISGNDAGVLTKLTRSSTTATLVWPDHGMTTADSIVVEGASTEMNGTFAIAGITDANTLTYTVTDAGATVAGAGFKVMLLKVFDHDTLAAKTTADDGNYAFPVPFCRLNVTAYTSGKATLVVVSG